MYRERDIYREIYTHLYLYELSRAVLPLRRRGARAALAMTTATL